MRWAVLLLLPLLSGAADVPSLLTALSAEGVTPPPAQSLEKECATLALRLSVLSSSSSERPRYIHDVRVALRRLLTLVDAFSGALGTPARLQRELKVLRRATNRARDAELLHATLPAFRFKGALLPAQQLRRIQAVADGLMVHCAQREERGGAAAPGAAALARPLRRLADAAAAAAGAAAAACDGSGGASRGRRGDAACFPALHRARTRAKQLRYALRALGRSSGAAYEALSAAQDALGAFGDAEVVREGLQRLARKRKGAAARRVGAAASEAEAAREAARGAAVEALVGLEKVARGEARGAPPAAEAVEGGGELESA